MTWRTVTILFLIIVKQAAGQSAKLMLPIGHSNSIISADLSFDDRYLLTTSVDFKIKLWDAQTGQLLKDYLGGGDPAVFSSNGKTAFVPRSNSFEKWNVQRAEKTQSSTINAFVLAYNDDRSLMAAVNERRNVIRIYSTGTLKEIQVLTGHRTSIRSLNFSGDHKFLVSNDEQEARVWDLFSGKCRSVLRGHVQSIYGTTVSLDNKFILTFSADSTAIVWAAATGKQLYSLHQGDIVTQACFSPDGQYVLTACSGHVFKLWSLLNGQLIHLFRTDRDGISSCKFSGDNSRIYVAADGIINVWDIASQKLVRQLKGHLGSISAMYFTHDQKKILSVSDDQTARLWDLDKLQTQVIFQGHTLGITESFLSADHTKALTFQVDGKPKLWDMNTGKLLNTIISQERQKYGALSSDGLRIVTASEFCDSIAIWDAVTGKILHQVYHPGNGFDQICFAPGDSLIVASGKYSGLEIFNSDLKKVMSPDLRKTIWPMEAAKFSKDGKKALVWSATFGQKTNSYLSVVDLMTRKTNFVNTIAHVNYGSFSSNGKFIVTGGDDGLLKIWDSESGVSIKVCETANTVINSCEFTPDGKLIVAATNNGVMIWNASTGKLLSKLATTGWPKQAIISPDGKSIIETDDWNHTLTVWRILDHKKLFQMEGHGSDINSVNLSTDGKRLLSSSSDGSSIYWDLTRGKQLYSFFSINKSDYLITDPFGRFDGTDGARKLLYFMCGKEPIGLEQLKDQLWVLNLAERITRGDTIYASKLNDMNICGLLPTVEKQISQDYRFKITPGTGGLGETALSVNGIEVKRFQPFELEIKGNDYELRIDKTQIKPYLVAGQQNNVTVKSYTSNNKAGSRIASALQDERGQMQTPPNLYAIVIGISEYKGAGLRLKYAARDADKFSPVLASAANKFLNKDGKEHVFIYDLTTGEGHRQVPEKLAIKNVFSEIGKRAKANDILLIFFAGHGLISGEKKQYYFLTADASENSANSSPQDVGISTQELIDWMQPSKIKAQKRVLIFDACNSGQAINEMIKIGEVNDRYKAARNDDASEQAKAIDKLNERSGLFILAASASDQSAYELGTIKDGLLTYALLKSLKQDPSVLDDGKYINVGAWFRAAEKMVSGIVRESGYRQEPQIVGNGNFNIGMVDQKLLSDITLNNERPFFTASNFQNSDESMMIDNLGLAKLLDNKFITQTSDESKTRFSFFQDSNSPAAYKVIGRYSIVGNKVALTASIYRGKSKKASFALQVNADQLNELADKVLKETIKFISHIPLDEQ